MSETPERASPPDTEEDIQYAALWPRFKAGVFDVVLLVGCLALVVFSADTAFAALKGAFSIPEWSYAASINIGSLYLTSTTIGTKDIYLMGSCFMVFFIYHSVIPVFILQTTIGNHMLGNYLAATSGQRCSLRRATWRTLLISVPFFLCALGILGAQQSWIPRALMGIFFFSTFLFFVADGWMIQTTEHSQSLHDYLSGTIITTKKPPKTCIATKVIV